ncbi:hypothetical protein EVAR_95897_1 [Eumeta japonica]|uniref:Uncharacterized protein n=1 Tax=Eumeta variegata TaxID=151549 RepID=A0A4C1XIX5_EUMVA|nr:hypothetical protein EVAR_95897_1 [Eumeta japonica]
MSLGVEVFQSALRIMRLSVENKCYDAMVPGWGGTVNTIGTRYLSLVVLLFIPDLTFVEICSCNRRLRHRTLAGVKDTNKNDSPSEHLLLDSFTFSGLRKEGDIPHGYALSSAGVGRVLGSLARGPAAQPVQHAGVTQQQRSHQRQAHQHCHHQKYAQLSVGVRIIVVVATHDMDGSSAKKLKQIILKFKIRNNQVVIYAYEPETKQQSTVWVFHDEANLTKVIRAKSTLNQMVACLFGLNGHVVTEPLEDRETANSEWCKTREAVAAAAPPVSALFSLYC